MSQPRVSSFFANALADGGSQPRLSNMISEALIDGYSAPRISSMLAEALIDGYSAPRLSNIIVQALFPSVEEPVIPTTPFPGFGNSTTNPAIPAALDPFNTKLPGLSIEVMKRPNFNTKIDVASSGNEVRTSYTDWPRWTFELSYEFLEDRTGAESSLKTIMGFFTDQQGSFGSWLFKDPDDYAVQNGEMGQADGVTTQFYFRRYLGQRGEPVGTIDQANTISVYRSIDENGTVPGSGPYTITVANAASFVEDLGVEGPGGAFTKVTGSPAVDQYSVDELTGVYTFNSLNANAAVTISYRYLIDPADYTLFHNYLVFNSAPASGAISASFQFFYVCRFLEDEMDFEKFADKLWSLQTCEFRSILT